MPKIISIPGSGEVEFPDEMSDEDIGSVVSRQFSGSKAAVAAPDGFSHQPEVDASMSRIRAFEAAGSPAFVPPPVTWEATKNEWMHSPINDIPDIPTTKQAPASLIEKALTLANPVTMPAALTLGPETAAQLTRSVANQVKGLAGFATSPVGIATAGIGGGALGKIPKALLEAYFAADVTAGGAQQAGDLYENWDRLSVPERADKLVGLGMSTALAAGLATGTALDARSLIESKSAAAAREAAKQLDAADLNKLTPDEAAQVRLRLPTRAPQQEMLPEVARTQELVDRALQEATQKIQVPGQIPAIDLLKARDNEILPAESRPAIRIPGGGEAPYGKVSFMREAEAPTTEGAQVRQPAVAAPQEIIPAVEEAVPLESKPLNPGGPISELSPELQAKNAEAVAAQKKIAEDFKKGLETQKQPWEMTKAEWSKTIKSEYGRQGFPDLKAKQQTDATHAKEVADAVKRGDPVPAEVLKDYPDLQVAEKPSAPAAVTPEKTAAVAESAPAPAANLVDQTIQALQGVQKKLESGFHKGDAALGLPKAALNMAIEAVILALKAGKTIGEALDSAIKKVRFNYKDKFDENGLRDWLTQTAAQETKPSETPKTEATQVAQPAVPSKGETLDDIHKIFEPVKDKKKPSLGQRASQAFEAFRTGVSGKFRPLDKLAEDIAKDYGITSPIKIAHLFDQLKGSSGKAEADIYRFDQDVARAVRGNEKDFNAYMFLRRSLDRLNQDQADISRAISGERVAKLNRRSVGDYTIPQLESKLAKLTSDLGPERTTLFEKAADNYQKHLDAALKLQVESGRMSPDVYAAIKEGNQFYAPFKVMKYLMDTSMPEGSGRRVDTLADYTKAMEGIHDKDLKLGDMIAAGRQSIAISRILAEKNRAMLNLSKLAGYDTGKKFIFKLGRDQEVPQGMEAVNVLEGGKPEKYAVNKDVANAVQIYGQNGNNVLIRLMGAAAVPFRAGATALNLPFQVSNLLADQPRAALISKYGLRQAQDIIRYPLDFAHALITSINADVLGNKNKLFLDFLDSGAAGTTIQESLTPRSLTAGEKSTLRKVGGKLLYTIPDFAQAIEQTSKILGVKRAMRFEGVKSGKELAAKIPEAVTEIRRFSGSPDFGRQGKWVEQARLNILYMFFNARLQGTISDLGRAFGAGGGKNAAATWARVGVAVGVPTAYLYALNHSKENADDYDKRPAQEKQNYWLIPKDSYVTNSDGEKVRDYWRIPKRESAKWVANMLESAMDFSKKQDPENFRKFAQGMIEDISPVNIQGNTFQERLESTATSLNPLIKAPIEVAAGRDLYRHRNIVPDQMKNASPELQYTDRTSEVFKKLAESMPKIAPEVFRSPLMLENMTRNLTAGLLTQFLPQKKVEGRTALENNPLLQRFQSSPITDRKAFDEEMSSLKREGADEQLTRHRRAVEMVDGNKGKSLEAVVEAGNKKYGVDPKLIRHTVDLWVAEQRGITGEEKQVLGLPAEQRAAYIAARLKGKPPEVQQQLIEQFASKRILTEPVAAELAKIQNP